MSAEERTRRFPQPMCPVRAGDPCSLCIPGASGPQDCPIVQLVMDDPELRERAHELRRAARRRQG
ncbi:hypothetical protein L2X99_14590 [Microbacterium sp. KUDC0406]|uniref:DUF6767 domain-containing protein n=1 Tax=Microbacterium sp. KUDC0406 TaxID=2909588 RepID=UPI001F22E033|nr:DUF6767 domain-containing protein [Microbacterium sp. KUDC0406]UJP09626.1 hypothetical protein L2X99_14590 [Microbacterium sp. KUDC0406]